MEIFMEIFMGNLILELFALLIIKHFIVDFLLQTSYQWSNKGTFGHPGGLLHAGLHGIGTYLCLVWPYGMLFLPLHGWIVPALAIGDAVVHYFIDWAKMNINQKTGWKPDTHMAFWNLLGLDQLLHYFTYWGIIKIIVDNFEKLSIIVK